MLNVLRQPAGFSQPSSRLDHRLRFGLIWIAVLLFVLSPIVGIASGKIMPPLAALLGASIIFLTVRSEDDIFIAFLVQSPSITYTFTTLLFALLSGNIALSGMYDADRAFLVVILYQIGVVSAYAFLRLVTYPGKFNDIGTKGFFDAGILTLISLLAALLLVTVRLVGIGMSLTPNIIAFCWLTVALAGLAQRPGSYKASFTIVASTLIALSLFANQRTYMFSIVLFTVFFYLTHALKALSFFRIVLVLVSAFCLGVVSQAFVNARPNDRSAIDPVQVLTDTLTQIGSAETWVGALPDLSNEQEQRYVQLRSAYYSRFLQGGVNATSDQSLSIGARLAQIGHMDIVTGKYPLQDNLDGPMWKDHLVATATASPEGFLAPLYSDELVWNLGLRPRPLIGRPLVSVAGELYMLSGIYLLPVITFIIFLLLIGQALIYRAAIGYSSAYVISSIMAMFTIIFTGTVFGLLNTAARVMPLLIVAGWVCRRLTYRHSLIVSEGHGKGIFGGEQEVEQ